MTTTTLIRLEPVQVHPGELLLPGMTQRNALEFRPDDTTAAAAATTTTTATTELVLGRNITTGIADRKVHRHAATIRYIDGKVWLQEGDRRDSSGGSSIANGGGTLPSSQPADAEEEEEEDDEQQQQHQRNVFHRKRPASSVLINGLTPETIQTTQRRRRAVLSRHQRQHQQQQSFPIRQRLRHVEQDWHAYDDPNPSHDESHHGVELHHGDIIVLEGARKPFPCGYSYQLQITKRTTPAQAAAAAPYASSATASPSHWKRSAAEAFRLSPPTRSPRKRSAAASTLTATASPDFATSSAMLPSILESIGNEAMCAICMEIQVKSQSLVPCGHSFCESCIINSTGTATTRCRLPASCPVCRMHPVSSHVSNLALDNIIQSMIEAQSSSPLMSSSFFDAEDIATYLERSGKKRPPMVPTAIAPVAAAAMAPPPVAAARAPVIAIGSSPTALRVRAAARRVPVAARIEAQEDSAPIAVRVDRARSPVALRASAAARSPVALRASAAARSPIALRAPVAARAPVAEAAVAPLAMVAARYPRNRRRVILQSPPNPSLPSISPRRSQRGRPPPRRKRQRGDIDDQVGQAMMGTSAANAICLD